MSRPQQPEATRFPDKGWDGWITAHPGLDDAARVVARAAYYGGWMARRPHGLTIAAGLAKWFLACATLAFYIWQLVK